MGPKGSRKRAASTDSQTTKPPKAPRRPEPTRTSRRLRSASPSSQSPLRALSPPKKRGRRKPKSIPEEVEEEQRQEQAAVVDQSQDTNNDNDTVAESQDSRLPAASTEDSDTAKQRTNNVDASPVDEPDAVHAPTEHSDADDDIALTRPAGQDANGQSQGLSDAADPSIDDQAATEPKSSALPSVETDNVHLSEDREVHLTGDNSSPAMESTENQLYTSKPFFAFAVRAESPCSSNAPSFAPAGNVASSPDESQDFASSGYGSESSDLASEDLQRQLDSSAGKSTNKLRCIIHGLRRDLRKARRQRAFFQTQSDHAAAINHDLIIALKMETEKADSFKVQSQASRKLIESQRILLQQLRNRQTDEGPDQPEDTSRQKRPAPVDDASTQGLTKRSSRRVKTLHDQQRDQATPLSQRLQPVKESTDNANYSIPNANGDYLMSGALASSTDTATPSVNSLQVGPVEQQTPKTPNAGGSWGRLFNPVASVKRLFTFGGSSHADSVHPTDPVPHSAPSKNLTHDETPQPSKTESPTQAPQMPPLRDAFGIPRQRRVANLGFTPASGQTSAQSQAHSLNDDATNRVPGSFVSFDEDPTTPVSFHKPAPARHSFMPQTAPPTRRAQSGLQRRLQHQRQMANAEAKKVAEERERSKREEEAEMSRMRRDALYARSMDIPPEVIRASFINKFGASAREIQEAQDKGITIGMKRKARDVSPESIPNPPGSSYGINDDFFDNDESVLNEPNQENIDVSLHPAVSPLDSAQAVSTTPAQTPTLYGSTLISRLFGSPSKSTKRRRLDQDPTFHKAVNHSALGEGRNDATVEGDDPSALLASATPQIRAEKLVHDDDSSALPQLRFKRDAETGQLEPVKAPGGKDSRNSEFQDQFWAPHVAPWYSGPFTPSKHSGESPSDQLFRSPTVLNMKHRHEFKGDFIGESNKSGNAFSALHYANANDGTEDVDEPGPKRPKHLNGGEAVENTGQNNANGLEAAVAYGERYGYWTGPRGTGQFAVPESDSDEDDDAPETPQLALNPVSLAKASSTANTNAESFVSSGEPVEGEPLSGEEVTRPLTNVFSMSQTEVAEDTSSPSVPKPSSAESLLRSGADAPATPAALVAKDTDALARARSQAEKYKPKTPSTLRAISAMSSPLPLPNEQRALGEGEDDESAEEVDPVTPRVSPTDAMVHPASHVAVDDDSEEALALARELANSIPVEELPIEQFSSWPSPQPAPWAHLIDDQIRAVLDDRCKGSQWDAYCDEVWKTAIKTWQEESSA